jgi:hypothetical protein
MRYLLLINSNEQEEQSMSPEDGEKLMAAYGTFTQELMAAGVMKGADRLRPTSTATTVRVRNGETLTTDGPFAETKEQLGGYYEIDVKDLDEAIKWAAKIPSAAHGSVEVRPIWD